MSRTLVIGDIHGALKALQQVIIRANITEDDFLIFLGDYVDGWSESAELIEYLIKLSYKNKCIFIRGNHDTWFQQWFEKGELNDVWLMHGGLQTKQSYENYGLDNSKHHIAFFHKMMDYYLDDKKRLFVHAGYTSMHGVEKEQHSSNFYWDRTLWEAALTLRNSSIKEDSFFYPNRFRHYSEIYIGHTPTINYNISSPIQARHLWNIDTGAAFSGKLTIMDIVSKKYWQSDKVQDLYPNEKGRN